MNGEFYTWMKSLTDDEKVIVISKMYGDLVKTSVKVPASNMITISGLLMVWYYTYQRRFEKDIYRVLAAMTLYNLGICFNITDFNLFVADYMEIYEPILSITEWNEIISELDENVYDDLRYKEKIFDCEFNDIDVRMNTIRMENRFAKDEDVFGRIQYFDDNGFNFMSYFSKLCHNKKVDSISSNETKHSEYAYQSSQDNFYVGDYEEIYDDYFNWSDYYGEEPDSNGDYSNEPVDWD